MVVKIEFADTKVNSEEARHDDANVTFLNDVSLPLLLNNQTYVNMQLLVTLPNRFSPYRRLKRAAPQLT
jgi:hypothetical protein